MDEDITFIFPIQLFQNIKYITTKNIYLIEEPIFFTNYNFHKMKIAYLRTTMKCYYDYLKKKLKNHNIKYINFYDVNDLFYKNINNKNIYMLNPTEHLLTNKLIKIFKNRLIILPTQNFLLNDEDIEFLKTTMFKNSYNHNTFYIYQRKKLNILFNSKNNKPDGNKWSFDEENRKKLPNKIDLPLMSKIINNKYTKEGIDYVDKYFKNNYGEINFIYPITHKTSIEWLDNFLNNKLSNFGIYEDAISEQEIFIFHSVLSPMMNIGLLTDTIVINKTLDYYNNNKNKIKLQNIEGFIRQLIGWRNYIYAIYMIEKPVLDNIFKIKSNNKTYHKLWTGTTNIYPIDCIIKNKLIPYAYCHHTERLMVLANFMKFCEIDNGQIYRLFMEWTVDSTNWVMYANIYGMVLNIVKIMKKNYIASSNYIFKMSNYKDINLWSTTFNCLYYNYISKNIDILKSDYGLRFQLALWKKKTLEDKNKINNIAENYIILLNT